MWYNFEAMFPPIPSFSSEIHRIVVGTWIRFLRASMFNRDLKKGIYCYSSFSFSERSQSSGICSINRQLTVCGLDKFKESMLNILIVQDYLPHRLTWFFSLKLQKHLQCERERRKRRHALNMPKIWLKQLAFLWEESQGTDRGLWLKLVSSYLLCGVWIFF